MFSGSTGKGGELIMLATDPIPLITKCDISGGQGP